MKARSQKTKIFERLISLLSFCDKEFTDVSDAKERIKMIALEISSNGEKVCTVGPEGLGILSAAATWLGARRTWDFRVRGITDEYGYDPQENLRLQDQASTLVELLHCDTAYPAGRRVLEAGCGVGAQTVTLAKNSPKASIISIDISEASLIEAKRNVEAAGLTNVQFQQGDIFHLPFEPESFDQGIKDLYRTTEQDGVFCYTFFKALAKKA